MRRRVRGLTIQLIPEEGGESRSLRLSARGARLLFWGGGFGVLVLAIMAASWWFLALEATRGWRLEAVVDSLEGERAQVLALARRMEEVEAGYEHLRSLFGPSADPVAPDLWLPPSGISGSRGTGTNPASEESLPAVWPLTEPGFITQPLIQGSGGRNHPGLDIAIPTGSYIRAAGAGRVLRGGEDPIYGRFVVLDHGGGYQTVYAHASMILVDRGETVRRGEVIALTGSTGQSTAPHLHFEILLEGLPLDPISMVEQPG
ncbi:MAG: M23 family metallopeptidase [Gemmatimonadota bacterium]